MRSEPSGASIVVNGRPLPNQRTDAWITLPRGRHEVLLVGENRVAERRIIDVAWGRAVGEASDPINLRPALQTVFFLSDPIGAAVVLEDPATGVELRRFETPDDPQINHGTYRMRFELPGHRDPLAGQTLSITGGDAITVERQLEALP
jgi:hypothetical protein